MVEHVLNLQFLKYTQWHKKARSFDMTSNNCSSKLSIYFYLKVKFFCCTSISCRLIFRKSYTEYHSVPAVDNSSPVWCWTTYLVSNQPTVNFVSGFIQTKKRNSFRSFSFYLAWEIRSWQILPKTIMKHALFFPLKKNHFTSIRLNS